MKYFLTAVLFFLTSCQQLGESVESPLSGPETRKAIISVIGEPRKTSETGREILSKYYNRKDVIDENPEKLRDRYFIQVTIVGDRRPYDVHVKVVLEKKQDGQYDAVAEDESRAAKVLQQIQKNMNESRDRRNLIDDFKPF